MRIALYEPEIAGNVGAVMRLGACLGVAVDLIEPLGFAWDDRRVRRTAMDYIDHVSVTRHAGFTAFQDARASSRLVLFTTKATQSAYDFRFAADDVLLFGKESAGVPHGVADSCDVALRLLCGAIMHGGEIKRRVVTQYLNLFDIEFVEIVEKGTGLRIHGLIVDDQLFIIGITRFLHQRIDAGTE